MEVFAWIYQDRKTGKNRSAKGIMGYVILYLFLFGYLGFIFWTVADSLCQPLVSVDLGWMYMVMMGLIALALGVFGSVFNTYTSLYQAKDNDLLLSMPIPSYKILMVRLVGVYLMGLMYELIVMIPAVLVLFLNVKLPWWGYVFSILVTLMLSILILTLSCVLGFVVALIGSKLKNKTIVTVFLSLAFFAAYYVVYMKAFSFMEGMAENPGEIGNKMKSYLYPFYHMGHAAMGNGLSMLIFAGIVAALFALVYMVLSRSFVKITTTNKGETKVKYREKKAKAGNVRSALLKKELRRFLGSSNYMLNCGLGLVFMIIAAVFLLIKGDMVTEMLDLFLAGEKDIASLIAVAAIGIMVSMNDITAPSVSLEGKNIWLVQSLPVSAADVLMAKLKLHLYLTLVPAGLLTAAVLWILKPAWYLVLLMPISVFVFVLLMALLGLVLNLIWPNLKWTNEAVPIKQSMSVMVALFGGWVIIFGLGGIYAAIWESVDPVVYLSLITVILAGLSMGLLHYVKTKGARRFETL